ncbi:MAG: PD-(D/E)XK nuclease family protein, partial [Myxococcota bacterium]
VALERLREETEGDESTEGIPILAAPPGPRVAAAVGTAVHRLLERVDLAGDLAAQLERGREALEDELVRELPADERAEALDHAEEVMARFRRGPLFRRWCELAPHFVAREFDVLLPGDPETPGSHLVGVVDLLYRDPETGELVVADYKTDRIAPGEDAAAHASRYGGQGASYARAVQEAFALARRPRFELWFLSSGDVFTPA